MIQKLYKLVEEQCKSKKNIYGYQAWKYHFVPTVKFSKILAKKLKADQEIVEIAALLHDYASVKSKGLYQNHHISGANEAKKILKKFNYPQEKIEKVKRCIYSHRASKQIQRRTIEEVCVANADAMAHFDNIPSLLYLAYVTHKMDIDSGKKWVLDKLERSWNKLIPEAKKIIQDKYEASKIILR